MDDLRICGSCHTLVQVENDFTKDCPRCQEQLDPDAESLLRKFIATGIVQFNRKGGITLYEAQKAASEVLLALLHERTKLELHHLEGMCSDCSRQNRETE